MLSDFNCEKAQESSVPGAGLFISVLISNYPLSNGGYLVSFSKEKPDGSYENYDPVCSLDFNSSKLSMYLDFSPVFLPKGCFYLPELELTGFVRTLAFDASYFEMKLLPASSHLQGLLVIKVDEDSLSNYEQEEED